MKRQLDAAKSEVKAHMDQCMAEQKHLASEKAMEHLDASSVQEVHENDWLKNEAEVHRSVLILNSTHSYESTSITDLEYFHSYG